jgi:hypothetical protein
MKNNGVAKNQRKISNSEENRRKYQRKSASAQAHQWRQWRQYEIVAKWLESENEISNRRRNNESEK